MLFYHLNITNLTQRAFKCWYGQLRKKNSIWMYNLWPNRAEIMSGSYGTLTITTCHLHVWLWKFTLLIALISAWASAPVGFSLCFSLVPGGMFIGRLSENVYLKTPARSSWIREMRLKNVGGRKEAKNLVLLFSCCYIWEQLCTDFTMHLIHQYKIFNMHKIHTLTLD